MDKFSKSNHRSTENESTNKIDGLGFDASDPGVISEQTTHGKHLPCMH